MKNKLRYAFGISSEEYKIKDSYSVMQLLSELSESETYIGYTEVWSGTLKVFLFKTMEGRDSVMKASKDIGFDSTGLIEEHILISNQDIKRPHLNKYKKNYSYYKELYK